MKHSFFVFLVFSASICTPFSAPLLAAQAGGHQSVETIRLRAGEPPGVNLTSELMYRILIGEIAAQRGLFDTAAHTFLDLARDTSDARLAKMAFQAALIQRDMVLASRAAQQWVLLAPDDPEAIASSLALAASNGEISGLATALRERITVADDKAEAIAQAAGIVAKLGDRQAAVNVLDQTFDAEALKLPVAHLALSDAAWAAGDAPRALDEARQALVLEPGLESAAQRMLEYGMQVDPETAFARAETFIRDHPDATKVQLLLANHKIRRQDFDGALRLVQEMRQRNPEDFDLVFTEAEINAHAGRYEPAKRLLNEYISVQSQRRNSIHDQASSAVADSSDARLLLVRIAEQQGDLHEAIRQLGLIDDPALAFQAQIHKAVLQSRQGLVVEARETIEKLQAQDSREDAVKALTLASIYRSAGRTEHAVEVLEAADKKLLETPEIKYDLGMLYERQGRYDDFESMMLQVIELEPNNANAYNSLGYTFADKNIRLDEAGELLGRAIELEPDSPYILDSIGWYLYRIEDYEGALDYLQRSYDLMPSAEVAAHLGEVLWTVGRRNEAQEIWKAGRAHDAENTVLLETLDRFGVRH